MEMNLSEPRWYVVQAMSGQENKAQKGLLQRIENDKAVNIDDLIYDVVIPEETVEERKNGKKTIKKRKLYPGYLLIKTSLYGEDGMLNSIPYHAINETNGIIGFVGNAERPLPLAESDVVAMLKQQAEQEVEKPKIVYQVGETVIIKDGAFEGYEGLIENVDPVRQKLNLAVSIFGRSTPCEVEIWQVERPS